jgi:hypothetical protein
MLKLLKYVDYLLKVEIIWDILSSFRFNSEWGGFLNQMCVCTCARSPALTIDYFGTLVSTTISYNQPHVE